MPMRRLDWEDRCKRHPEHPLSKGVCPYCLRDRLAHLSASSSSATTTTRASASTSPTSSPGSPSPHHAALSADVRGIHVVGGGSSFVNVAAFSQPLMPTSFKKQGMQEAASSGRVRRDARKGKEEVNTSGNKKKKIGRFLSRLVGAEKRRKTGDGDYELFHSKTMKEKTSSRWIFF